MLPTLAGGPAALRRARLPSPSSGLGQARRQHGCMCRPHLPCAHATSLRYYLLPSSARQLPHNAYLLTSAARMMTRLETPVQIAWVASFRLYGLLTSLSPPLWRRIACASLRALLPAALISPFSYSRAFADRRPVAAYLAPAASPYTRHNAMILYRLPAHHASPPDSCRRHHALVTRCIGLARWRASCGAISHACWYACCRAARRTDGRWQRSLASLSAA